MEYTTLLLDMDGTFLDFGAAEKSAFYRAMEKNGYEAGEDTYQLYSRINHGLWEAFERGEIDKQTLLFTRFSRLFAHLGIDGDGVSFEKEYQLLLGEGHELMENAREVLEYLYSKYDLYVVTNGVEATQRSRLRLSGIERFMKDIFVSEAVGFQKPQMEFFEYCFAHIDGFEKDRAMIIGDSLTSDIQGGNNAGIACCWFNPAGKERPLGLRIDKEIERLAQLTQFL